MPTYDKATAVYLMERYSLKLTISPDGRIYGDHKDMELLRALMIATVPRKTLSEEVLLGA